MWPLSLRIRVWPILGFVACVNVLDKTRATSLGKMLAKQHFSVNTRHHQNHMLRPRWRITEVPPQELRQLRAEFFHRGRFNLAHPLSRD
jgi:hypothetical protein